MEGSPIRPRVVRWLGAYARPADLTTAAWWEAGGTGAPSRERAAEPLWRGRSLILAELHHVMVGLVFDPADVTRAWVYDAWTEPHESGRLVQTSDGVRAWRRWDAFAARWAGRRPERHGEVALRKGALPVAVAYRQGDARARACAEELGAALDLPVVAIRPLRMEDT